MINIMTQQRQKQPGIVLLPFSIGRGLYIYLFLLTKGAPSQRPGGSESLPLLPGVGQREHIKHRLQKALPWKNPAETEASDSQG